MFLFQNSLPSQIEKHWFNLVEFSPQIIQGFMYVLLNIKKMQYKIQFTDSGFH